MSGQSGPRLSASISWMFAELAFLDRPGAAADAGFAAVECHYPYDVAADEFRRALADAGLPLLGINTAVKRLGPADTGVAAVPGYEAEARRRFDEALDYLRAAGGSAIHVKPGEGDPACAQAHACFVAHLRECAALAAPHGVTLLIEPLNRVDSPGYFLRSNDQAAAILREVGDPTVRLMFDLYHMGLEGADILSEFDRHRALVGHVQFAGLADRGEPEQGEHTQPGAPGCMALLAALHHRDYSGWIGAEYRPRGNTRDGLGWMARLEALCRDTP